MPMTEYFPISPFADGTTEVEAFGSLFCRMAQAHCVSIYTLTMHLRDWWKKSHPDDDRAKTNVVNATNPMLCGIGPNVATYLEIVAEATGCSTLEHTTFLPLKGALSQNGHGIVRADRAWCPACLEEAIHSEVPFYDRLVWALPYILRCPIHKVELRSSCPYCGSTQLHYHHLGHVELCCKCKRSLRSAPSTWHVISTAAPYEKECLDLVSDISLGNLKVIDDAYGIFIREFNQYLSPLKKKVSKFTYKAARRPQLGREEKPPRLETLLKRCAAFGVDPADVLRDPIQTAKSACLLEFSRLKLPMSAKPRRPHELVEMARGRLEGELGKTGNEPLPSLRSIARELGVSTGFINFQLGELVKKYAAVRKTNSQRSVKRMNELALSYLLSGPVKHYPSPEFPSQALLVEATVRETGVTIRTARNAVSTAFKMRFGFKTYERYRKRRRRDPSAQWPPQDALLECNLVANEKLKSDPLI